MHSELVPEVSIERRSPAHVMRLERLGSLHQSRLSFMRILLRRLKREQWTFSTPVFEVDAQGTGRAVVRAHGPERVYSLVAFFHDLPAEKRSDRVIAEAWDATFTLFDGEPSDKDLERLEQNVPLQEAGRISERELTLSRANRSVRLWEHVVDALSRGIQPDTQFVNSVGYLMRTTAVYGSGKFGAADRENIADRAEFEAPFQVEMLTVYLIRALVTDLVQAVANARALQNNKAPAATLDSTIAKSLGVGNSTGLGMAPFLVNHPVLLNNWMMVREEALLRVRRVVNAQSVHVELFRYLLENGVTSLAGWHSDHPLQLKKLITLKGDVQKLVVHTHQFDFQCLHPWDHLHKWAEHHLGIDAQEYLVSIMLEPYGELVDDLSDCLSADEKLSAIDGSMRISTLRDVIVAQYKWALAIDWQSPTSENYVWYVSAEKLEPRLGERHAEALDAYEQPLAPARDICNLHKALDMYADEEAVARLLMDMPEHRHALRRVQLLQNLPYAEIRDNTIDAQLLPCDLLRCKLAFFGATRFDPRSDRWVRICLFADAPYPEHISDNDVEFWPYQVSAEPLQVSHARQ